MQKQITLLNETAMEDTKQIRAYYHPNDYVKIGWDTHSRWLNTRTNDSQRVACTPYSPTHPHICTRRDDTDPNKCHQLYRGKYFNDARDLQFELKTVRDGWSTPFNQIMYWSYCEIYKGQVESRYTFISLNITYPNQTYGSQCGEQFLEATDNYQIVNVAQTGGYHKINLLDKANAEDALFTICSTDAYDHQSLNYTLIGSSGDELVSFDQAEHYLLVDKAAT